MRNKALQSEFKNISKNKMLIASLIVLLFVPIMYGGFFLGSTWDPYGNTKNLPVAVVNEDDGAELGGKKVNVGEQLEENLKKNDTMGWNFVSKADAEKGLDNGDYYMMVDVPKDFSKKAASILNDNPEKSAINYTLTPDRNYVASLLTSAAAKEIKNNVSKSVTDAYVTTIFGGLDTAAGGMKQAAAGSAKLSEGSATLKTGLVTYTDGVSKINAGSNSLVSGLSQISNGSAQLQSGLNQLQGGLPSDTDINSLTQGINSLQTGLNQLSSSVNNPSPEMVNAQADLTQKANGLAQASVKLSQTSQTSVDSITQLNYLAADIPNTFDKDNAQQIVNFINDTNNLAQNLSQFQSSFGNFQRVLQANQAQLKAGVNTLSAGMNVLAPSANTALFGYNKINSAVLALSSGAGTLTSSLQTAQAGSQTLVSGAGQLSSNSDKLVSGAEALEDGSGELASKLDAAAKQVSLQTKDTDKKTQQISEPITTNQSSRGNVAIYGYALAPYVLSIGLFVGALSFNVIYPIAEFKKKDKASKLWASKATVAGIVAVGQALILDLIMFAGLGLHPDNTLLFILMTILASLAFMSIISFLSIALDNVGRFLAMLLLVMQLGSAEGVFPIVLSSNFFQAMHPFVPMTYSIKGFKAAISNSLNSDMFWWSALIMAVIIVVFNLLLLAYLKLSKKQLSSV